MKWVLAGTALTSGVTSGGLMWLRRAEAAGHCLLTNGSTVFLELQSQNSIETNCHDTVSSAGLLFPCFKRPFLWNRLLITLKTVHSISPQKVLEWFSADKVQMLLCRLCPLPDLLCVPVPGGHESGTL